MVKLNVTSFVCKIAIFTHSLNYFRTYYDKGIIHNRPQEKDMYQFGDRAENWQQIAGLQPLVAAVVWELARFRQISATWTSISVQFSPMLATCGCCIRHVTAPAMPSCAVVPPGVQYKVPTLGPKHTKISTKIESIIILVKQMNLLLTIQCVLYDLVSRTWSKLNFAIHCLYFFMQKHSKYHIVSDVLVLKMNTVKLENVTD